MENIADIIHSTKHINMATKDIVVSSPGKVILHGEHSVVYGKLALAVCINLRTKVQIRLLPPQPGNLKLHFPDLKSSYTFSVDALTALKPQESQRLRHTTFSEIWLAHTHLVAQLKTFVTSLYPHRSDDQGIIAFLFLLLVQSRKPIDPMEVTVTSEIPIGAGLGSSAAYSVAIAGALHRLNNPHRKGSLTRNSLLDQENNNHAGLKTLQTNGVKKQKLEARISLRSPNASLVENFSSAAQEEICQWAFLAEKILHGNPSGIDNSVCTFGGLLSYQSSTGKTPLKAPDNLRILLINTRVSRNTKALVERVRSKVYEFPKVTNCILEAMDKVSHHCLDTLTQLRKLSQVLDPLRGLESGYGSETSGSSCNESSEDSDHNNDDEQEQLFRKLEVLIDTNQGLLSALGVSHPTLDRIQAIAGKQNLHAKLTGAGGGGFAFALITPSHTPKQVKIVREEMESNGFDCWETVIGGAGVHIHNAD